LYEPSTTKSFISNNYQISTMKESNAKLIKIFIASVLVIAFLGSVINLAPVIHAQMPLMPGLATQATKANATTNMTTPAKPTHMQAISGLSFMNATGSIASLQNSQVAKPHGTWYEQFVKNGIWLLSGKWNLVVPSTSTQTRNVTAPSFDATFNMAMINGTAMHKHKISDFRIIGNPVRNSTTNSIILRGTVTVTLKDGPHTNVPIIVTLIDKSVIRIGVDRTKTEDHFGGTPIFGSVARLS
jgi:hypothetical protein